jgi:uncharacterized protein
MKPKGLLFFSLIVLFSFVLSGCFSIPSSPSANFYTLHPVAGIEGGKQLEIAPKLIIGIGPVEIPEYQNRPQIVTRDKNGMLIFAQFERWGESLDTACAHLILENLTAIFPQADFQIFPCNFSIPLDYQVIVNIAQLESQLDKDIILTAQWTIVDSRTKAMLLTKRFQVRQEINPHTYSGLTQALSKEVVSLSDEIAENLVKVTNESKAKDTLGQ